MCYADAYQMLVEMTPVFNSLTLNKYVSSDTHGKCLNSLRKLKADLCKGHSEMRRAKKDSRIRVQLKINDFSKKL